MHEYLAYAFIHRDILVFRISFTMCTHVCASMCVCMCVCACVCVCMCVSMCVCACVCVSMCACIYCHLHKHFLLIIAQNISGQIFPNYNQYQFVYFFPTYGQRQFTNFCFMVRSILEEHFFNN